MSGDISLSRTLGGLRIANPDDSASSSSPPAIEDGHSRPLVAAVEIPSSSPSSASSTSKTPTHASGPGQARPSSHSSSGTVTATQQRPRLPSYSTTSAIDHMTAPVAESMVVPSAQLGFVDPCSQLGFVAGTGTGIGIGIGTGTGTGTAKRQSIPLGHQAQQQMQYPAAIQAIASRVYVPGSSRPISAIYNHPNVSGGSQSSSYSAYRYGDVDVPSQVPPPPPQRSSSRAAIVTLHQSPGMLALEGTSSREYNLPEDALPPPRRSSRRISPGISNTSSPAQAYVEGGPLPSSEEWKEKGAAIGIRREIDANGKTVAKVMKKGVKDFEFGRTLGEGSYSTVLAATDRTTLREYAIKVLDKRHIIKEKKVKYVNIEKDTLNRLNDHPGIVRLYYTFQDERSLYFVLDLASNGELLGVLKKIGTFDEECTRFYCAQILDAIDYMHSRGVLHRDLKPENVLLDSHMHIKITDFGTGKLLDDAQTRIKNGVGSAANDPLQPSEEHRAVSFVGTAEYVSPELLTAKEGGKPTDLWAFGCILYQLISGRPPFKGATEYLTFDKILKLDYSFPAGFPPVVRDLVERLLVPDPSKRLTVEHTKQHEFFKSVVWGKGLWKQKAPRLKAYVPPPPEPIRLNALGPTTSTTPTSIPGPTSQPRSHPRLITELPPPSQLDIEWSPVLTRSNERILKLGNLIVTVTPQPHSPNGSKSVDSSSNDATRKFSRFFMSSNTTKRRQRLVMITSGGRIILAPSGGDEKKAKMEISLLASGTNWKCFRDNKGLMVWCVDTRDKHILFEPALSPTPDPEGTALATGEWLDSLTRSRDFAMAQQSISGSYSSEAGLNELSSQLSSPASTIGGDGMFNNDEALDGVNVPTTSRMRREDDAESLRKGRKRFSRRQSKGGLAAVF